MNKEYLDHLSDMKIEEFDAISDEHAFSDTFRMEQKRLIRTYREKERRSRKFLGLPKVAAAALICLLGAGTAYAAVHLIHLEAEKKAQYSVEVQMEKEGGSDVTELAEIPKLAVSFGYLPEGMKESEKGEYFYISEDGEKGYYTSLLAADDAANWTETFVTNAEKMTIREHEALLVEMQPVAQKEHMQMDLYISYPEYDQIAYIWGWGSCSREEILQIAENMTLEDTGEVIPIAEAATWSNFAKYRSGAFNEEISESGEYRTTAADEKVEIHQIGERIRPKAADGEIQQTAGSIEARVADVQVADDLSLLAGSDSIPEEWLELTGEDGIMRDELVYVTVEYTNTGAEDLTDVWFISSLVQMVHEGDLWRIVEPGDDADGEADYAYYKTGLIGPEEMVWYDVHGGERNNNYIPSLKAGESQSVHMAWIADADSLQDLYLIINELGSHVFSPAPNPYGFVDLGLD